MEDRQFADRDAAADWIDWNQLARRNLSPDDFLVLIGRRYNRTKRRHGGDRKSSRQIDDLKTSESIASDHGVSARTVERAGELVDLMDEAKRADPELVKAENVKVLKAARELKKKKAAERKAKREDARRQRVSATPVSGCKWALMGIRLFGKQRVYKAL